MGILLQTGQQAIEVAQAALEQPILTNTIVVGVVGAVISFLVFALIKVLQSIWKKREKMFADEREERIAAETELKTDINGIKKSVQERKESEIKLTGSIESLDKTISGIKSWLGTVTNDQKTMAANLAKITGVVEQITSNKS